MKIVYSDYYCWPLPLVAVQIHLKLTKGEKQIGLETMDILRNSNRENILPPGKIRRVGKDKNGNELYITGNQGIGKVIERAVTGLSKVLGNKEEIVFVNLNNHYNFFLKFCITLYRLGIFNSLTLVPIQKFVRKELSIIEEKVNEALKNIGKEL
jgi:hypothetical protein